MSKFSLVIYLNAYEGISYFLMIWIQIIHKIMKNNKIFKVTLVYLFIYLSYPEPFLKMLFLIAVISIIV